MNRVGLVLLLVASCGDSPARIGNGWPPPTDGSVPAVAMAPEAVRSGTRLRARWEVAHGARRLIGWHDSQLGIDCGFDATNGREGYFAGRKHLCVPPVLETSNLPPLAWYAQLAPLEAQQAGYFYFADPNCTRQALTLGSSPATTHYVVMSPVNSCAADPAFFEVGSPVDPASTFEENATGVCVAAQQPPAPLYEIGAAVAPTTFAAATERADAVGQLWLDADDGARAPWGGWDGTRAVNPIKTTDGKVRWAPRRVAFAMNVAFADSACTVPIATKEAYNARCPLDAVLVFGPQDACGQVGISFSALGPPLHTHYVMQDRGCTAWQQAPYTLAYTIGAPIANERFQEVGEMRIGDGTIQVRYATMSGRAIRQTQGGGGSPQPDEFVDVASGLACIPVPARDGKTRCLPTSQSSTSQFFLDAACTEPLMPYVPSSCGDASASVPPVFTYDAADGTSRARPVMAPVTVTQPYSEDFFGPCMPASSPVGVRYYRLGPELPPDRFAEVTIEVD